MAEKYQQVDGVPHSIEDLTQRPESQWFERKSARIEPKDLAKALVGFANAEGGYIAVGVHDGRVESPDEKKMNAFRQASIDFTQPQVHARCRVLAGPNGEEVLLIAVSPGERVHRTQSGDVYLRIGDETRKLDYFAQQELEFDRGGGPFDGTPAPLGKDDLDWDSVQSFQELIGSSSPELALRARSLLTPAGDPTVAACLMFTKRPQDWYPEAYVRVLRYEESARGTGARHSLAAGGDVRCEGPLQRQIQEAAVAIERFLPARNVLGAEGTFVDRPLIPRDAWLEGLVNAVVHRSYSMMGDHIRIEIFPDRIEFTSPGRFPGMVDPSRPLEIMRHARNPRIARTAADLGYAKELGEGVRRIYEEMMHSNLSAPKYKQTSMSVILQLLAAPAVAPEILSQLSEGEKRAYDVLRPIAEGLRTGELAEALGISRPTMIRHLRRLRELGLVERNGSSPKDPSAVWLPLARPT